MNPANSPPKRGITISLLLEFIMSVAIGMALQQSVGRAILASQGDRMNLPSMPYRTFLVGLAATLSLGLAAETSQRREDPIRWGSGRWTIAAVTASSILSIGDYLAGLTVECFQGRKVPEPETIAAGAFLTTSIALMFLPYLLGGLWLVARLSRRPVKGIVDAREWAGRLLAVGFVATTIVEIAIGQRTFR